MDPHENKKSLRFRKEIIASMSPRERAVLRFDLAWKAANDGDYDRLMLMLLMLRQSLDFGKHPRIALNFLRVYNHCSYILETKRDFARVAQIMFEFKRAFSIAQENADAPEVKAEHARVRVARALGAGYFGQKGTHYGPRTAEERRLRNNARQNALDENA